MKYDTRNRDNLAKLGDHTKEAALKWYEYLLQNKIDVLIYETIRTVEKQKENVSKGASQTMKSYHIVGQALDFVPIVNGKEDWNGYKSPAIQQAIAEAKRLGFEWGGDWKSFIDQPHLQFNYKGYGTDTFGKTIAKEGWVKDNGQWFFYEKGAKKKGWVSYKSKWYYLNADGVMETDWVKVDGKWYFLNEEGAMMTGWLQSKGKWYYLNDKGIMQTGVIQVNGKLYFLSADGSMVTNTRINVTLNVNEKGELTP